MASNRLTTMYTWSFTTGPSNMRGDATGEGDVNSQDLTLIERIVVGLENSVPMADANADGKINALDVTKVERIIAKLD